MRGATIIGEITEHHGDVATQTGDIVSHDGINGYDIDIESWKRRNAKALIRFYWGARLNLREIYKPGSPVPPPSQRTAAPSVQYVASLARIALEYGAAPTPKFASVPLRSPNLWKSHAEDMSGIETIRENKPVFIVAFNGDKVRVVTHDKNLVCTMAYGGPFDVGLSRYYSADMYGWQIGRKAKRMSGSEFVWLQCGDKFYGPVNPAFRAGYFRQ